MTRPSSSGGDSSRDEALTRECQRLYRRYAVEVVETLGFCPYAERCRLEGRTREVVMLASTLDLERALAEVESLAADESIEVALLLWPRVPVGRAELSRFVERLRAEHQLRSEGMVMAMEGFHPDAEPDARTPERLVPFVRRTPDPTIQLVRHRILDHVRRGSPSGTTFFDPSMLRRLEGSDVEALHTPSEPRPLHERIAGSNHATILRRGIREVSAIMDDILRDRERSYEALGEPLLRRGP